jgi:hypothetical protein
MVQHGNQLLHLNQPQQQLLHDPAQHQQDHNQLPRADLPLILIVSLIASHLAALPLHLHRKENKNNHEHKMVHQPQQIRPLVQTSHQS